MSKRYFIALSISVLLFSLGFDPTVPVARGQAVTSPSAHLHRPLGEDFKLADWDEESSYFRLLGEESAQVLTQKVGTTTEGRDFLISVISSAENLANLDAIKAQAQIIADPRGHSESEIAAAVANGKVILFISCAMHATEAAGSQFGMEFAYRLATEPGEPWKSAREKMVVVLYVTNPDGVDHVTEWYRETVGTPFEASGLTKLYQYYAGHDNNRDWFMLTQNETQIVSNLLYETWFPQVYWDVHQQGSSRERFFVPPYRDPLNPNLDPNIITGIDALSSRALADMTREGFTGISTGVSYDMWWNGGNRNVPVRHNIIGILTEAASVNLASPMFFKPSDLSMPRGLDGDYAPSNQFPNPWPGGWWRLRDIIDYELAFGRSLLGSLSREPATWLENALGAAERTIARGEESAPKAWIIPSDNRDPDAVRRLVNLLLRTGVELQIAPEPIAVDGRTYPAGSIVIDRAQPYGQHIKDLMEVQRYPDGAAPYDVSGWTVPFILGVRRVEVNEDLGAAELTLITTSDEALAGFRGDERVINPRGMIAAHDPWSARMSSAWTRLAKALASGETVQMIISGVNEGIFLTGLPKAGSEMMVDIYESPRIGVYSPWSGSMDEGWTRYVLDTFEIEYVTVRNEMLRAGELGDFLDVLIMPSVRSGQLDNGRALGSIPDELAGGLAPEGAVAVEQFVKAGGRLITLGSSSNWAIELLELPLHDVTRGENAGEFSCPGSILRAVPNANSNYTAGMADSTALFFSRSSAYELMTEKETIERYGNASLVMQDDVGVLLSYAPARLLLSGWVREPKVIEGRIAWARVPYGAGEVHVFGFRPQYRGWTQVTFPLLFRAIFLDD